MNRQRIIKGLQITALLALIGGAAVPLFRRFEERRWNAVQLTNMAAAKSHLPVLLKLLHHDGRFDEIELSAYSGSGGSLLVHGAVTSEEKLQSLKEVILSSAPPVRVEYRVTVIPPVMEESFEHHESE